MSTGDGAYTKTPDSDRLTAGSGFQEDHALQARLALIWRRYPTVLLLLLLIVLFALVTPSFITARNLTSLLVEQVVIGCLSLAAVFPLVVGEFDLSIGYMVGFVVMWGAFLAEHHWSTPMILIGMFGGGLLIGLANGVLTVYFKISSFIATLGTGIVLSGVVDGLSGGQVLYSNIPNVVIMLGQGTFIGVAISVWLVILLAVVTFMVLEHTPAGRHLYAIGGSERVAFLAGVRTHRLKTLAFIAAGFLVAIGAIFELGQAGAATPGWGASLLLPAYASVFLGVTTYRPGYFNVIGTIVAIMVLAVGFDGLSLLGVPFWVQPIFNGAVLLVAVLSARAESRHVRVG